MKKKKEYRSVTTQEREYIRENCLIKSDETLSKELNRDLRTIARIRKSLGIHKGQKGTLQPLTLQNNPHLVASQKLTEHERKEFFKTQLTNSLYYNSLKEQFTKDEIDFYLEEWASLCVQFEDIVATEKRQIDELIKAQIMGNRILRNIKITEEHIKNLIKEVEIFRKANDMENDEDAQERDLQLMTMIRSMSGQSQAMSVDYQKNVNLKNNLLNELNARRRDRVDQITKRGTTFLGLIESLRERENREKQGRHLELIRLAKDYKKTEWRKPNVFPDGARDCVLLDEDSIIPTQDVVRMEDLDLAKEDEDAEDSID